MNGANDRVIDNEALESLTFSVIILRHSNSEVLLVHNSRHLALPTITIPKWRRPAQEITEGTLALWGLRTISLFHPEQRECVGGDSDHYVVLATRDASWQPPVGFRWVSRDELRNSFCTVDEARSLEDALANADAYNNGTLPGTFARADWFDDLVSWTQEQLDPYGLTLTGTFRQLNCGPSFSLVRLETTGPAVWFKAVGEPNLHEFPITTVLAKHFPRYLPTLITTQASWNGWLTFEAEGSTLDKKSDIATWKKAARTLADLQIESVRKTPTLLDAGCRNIGIPLLLNQIDPFLEVVWELMERQSKVPPPVLSSRELYTLAVHLKEICACLAEIGLPDTLGHLDFNPGNILCCQDRCVFLDWAEAYVGHPFFTLEYLREHLSRNHHGENAWQSQIRSCYLERWNSLMSVDRVSRALEITPLLAVFAYAVSNNTWRDSQRLQNANVAGYLRSLTRRMQREARLYQERRKRCLS